MFSAGAPVQWLSMLTRTPSPLQYSSCCSSCCLCSCRTHSFPDQHLIHSPTLQRGCFIHLHTTHILLSYSASHPGILGHLNDFFNFFFFGEGEGRRGKETSMCGCFSCPPNWDLAHNPGVCPDRESNQRPLGSQTCAQSTEPHQPGLNDFLKMYTH